MKTDDKKVKAIYDMQPPIDVSVVKDLHGRKHGKIPSYISTILQLIREFARKEKAWQRRLRGSISENQETDRNPRTRLFRSWKGSTCSSKVRQ